MTSAILQKYRQICDKNDWVQDEDQLEALTALVRLVEVKPKFRRVFGKKATALKQGVYMHGAVGRGKSFAMDLFFQTVNEPKKARFHFHEFMLDIHDRLHRQKGGFDLDAIVKDISGDIRLLCLDEFFVEDVADAMLLGRLFSGFFDQGMRVVFTSNIHPDDLYPDGLQRDRFLSFIALLKDKCDLIAFDGNRDYRADKLRDHKRYVFPNDKKATLDMTALFTELTDGIVPYAAEIKVKGRSLVFPETAKSVLKSDFETLCGAALGAADYLALAEEFSTVILENIPVCDDSRRNEIRRFIALIDTLYEKRRLVFMTAAQPVEYLYTGRQYAKAFARTQSRILEMQSPHYPS